MSTAAAANASAEPLADEQDPEWLTALTPFEGHFCAAFVAQGNAADAVLSLRPHVSRNAARIAASRLLRREHIRARVRELIEDAARAARVSITAVLAESARIAFADPGRLYWTQAEVDALEDTPTGELLQPKVGALKPVHLLDRDIRAAIAGVDVHLDYVDGAAAGETRKVKLWNKPQALRDLMEHLGMLDTDAAKLPLMIVNIKI